MQSRIIESQPRTWIVVMETGDELASALADFSHREKILGASLSAVGAFSAVELAWFDWDDKKYKTSVDLEEQVELVSLLGDIASKDGQPTVHAHLTVARHDGTVLGGHLKKAVVRPTCEVIVTEASEKLVKKVDSESGLALIHPNSAETR
jgi:predicted DNA-binding protein with PD1-like motif